MTVQPLHKTVYLRLDEVRVGGLDVSSYQSAVECAEVIAIGLGVEGIKPRDRVFVKAWAIDIVNHEGQRYCFCNQDTNGILAVIRDDV